MFLISVLASLLLASSVSTAPATTDAIGAPVSGPNIRLCQLPLISKLCPRQGSGTSPTVQTPLGKATGAADSPGVNRYSVQYATANRWAHSKVATSWKLPNGGSDPTLMPLACPQSDLDPSLYSEDCLSAVFYVPIGPPKPLLGTPILVWIPGGSFIIGSASDVGLDGSNLALSTDSIVVVIQHRLGALGFMAPDGTTNLAVEDVINALSFIKIVAPSLGGDVSKITLAGQSSGASMIRALLAAPSASPLFRSAILHSDPMDYGFLSPSLQTELLGYFVNQTSCAASDRDCFNDMALSGVLNASDSLFSDAMSVDPAAGQGEPMRPVRDGTLITTPLDSTAQFPHVSKPLMISTVQNEAGRTIYQNFPQPLPEADFFPFSTAALGEDRTQAIVQSPYYPGIVLLDGSMDCRMQLEPLGTDYLWKCASWTFARNWVGNGGTAYVGLYTLGATHPDNAGVPFCTQQGSVCHEDDIQIVFGTVQNPTAAQSALVSEVQQRYKAFLTNGNPNAAGLATWSAATTSNINTHNFGGTAAIPIGACDPSFWGEAAQYDYQVYNL